MSPDYPATRNQRELERSAAKDEVTRRSEPSFGPETLDEEAAEAEINATFHRMLMGLRRMPRRDRPHALRAAREWRRMAYKALREKRTAERHAKSVRRRLQTPTLG